MKNKTCEERSKNSHWFKKNVTVSRFLINLLTESTRHFALIHLYWNDRDKKR